MESLDYGGRPQCDRKGLYKWEAGVATSGADHRNTQAGWGDAVTSRR